MTADYVKPKNGLDGELVCSNCGEHPISKNGRWVITRHCHECGARIEKVELKPLTSYEDERSRILYTCEEKYDGSMVAYVIDLESQLKAAKTERDYLMKLVHDVIGCSECVHEEKPIDNPICKTCGVLGKNWE